jgi:hypothetical protein
MINHFLARLDNNPVSPGDWVWPTFSARDLSTECNKWRAAIVGNNLPRELLFRKCLVLDSLVASSEFSSYRTSDDSRLSYTLAQAADRVRNYGWSVTSSLGAPVLSHIIRPDAPDFATSQITANSASSITVVSTTGTETITVVYPTALSDEFNLVVGGSIRGRFSGNITTGQTWTFSLYQREDVLLDGLKAVRELGEPSWLPQPLLGTYRNLRTDTDKLACVVVGLTQ